jgi:hypothetical protein
VAGAVARAAAPAGARAPAAPAARSEERERARAGRRDAERSRRRFRALEQEIAERESALEALTFRLADPGLWSDPEQGRRLSADRDALRATLEGLYPEWERLANLLESPPPE